MTGPVTKSAAKRLSVWLKNGLQPVLEIDEEIKKYEALIIAAQARCARLETTCAAVVHGERASEELWDEVCALQYVVAPGFQSFD